MSDFKLIAIRPLPDCSKDFVKILNPGSIYPFYQGYNFYNSDFLEALPGDEICGVSIPDSKFPLHNIMSEDGYPINVSISAVVGKNGSGKSTLMDLFFAAIYLSSVSEKLIDDSTEKIDEHLVAVRSQIGIWDEEWQKALSERAVMRSAFDIKGTVNSKTHSFEKLAGEISKSDFLIEEMYGLKMTMINKEKELLQKAIDVRTMAEKVQVEIYFHLDQNIYCLRVIPENGNPGSTLIKLVSVNPDEDREEESLPIPKGIPASVIFSKESFFYTIAINYSHYALNALQMGDWVNSLFHKNDGYKTPLVINPMRDDGNFNINRELILAKYRLLANLLSKQRSLKSKEQLKLSEEMYVDQVLLKIDFDKVSEQKLSIVDDGLNGPKKQKEQMEDFFEVFFGDDKFGDLLPPKNKVVNLVLNYILGKIETITKYEGLKHFKLDAEGRSKKNIDYFLALKEEPSHITFKLKQAVNFLNRASDVSWPDLFKLKEEDPDDDFVYRMKLKDLLDWTGTTSKDEIINFLPPPIFKIDFQLINKNKKTSDFHNLSSGEQQMIYTLQTVLYHINNLQSVRYSKLPRLHYPSINLVFDEIELYFHPAYQRAFIKRLLEALAGIRVGEKQAIRSINIIFLTHSPFILSDIPKDQITMLTIDKIQKKAIPLEPEKQTFAANINELLAESFFLDGTLMGEFAEEKVNKLIKSIKAGHKLSSEQDALINLIGDSYLRNSIKYFLTKKDD